MRTTRSMHPIWGFICQLSVVVGGNLLEYQSTSWVNKSTGSPRCHKCQQTIEIVEEFPFQNAYKSGDTVKLFEKKLIWK